MNSVDCARLEVRRVGLETSSNNNNNTNNNGYSSGLPAYMPPKRHSTAVGGPAE